MLVVDDSASQRRVLRAHLARWGYSVSEASSGTEALKLFRAGEFDVVISDWMMPGMDGLQLCRACRETTDKPYSYFILLTSKSEKADIARGLDVGADDFVSKPVSSDELLARIRAGERILTMERELRENNRLVTEALSELSNLYDALDRDLAEARNLQQALVKERTGEFGAARVSLILQPSGHIGGDLVGFFESGADEIGLYSLDVSGHGVASALLTARLAAEFSGQTPGRNIALHRSASGVTEMLPPDETAARLNELFMTEFGAEQYLTMTLAKANLRTGRIQVAHCGAPGSILQHPDGSVMAESIPGYPVGMLEEARWECREFHMKPGMRLLFFSDGITECEDRDGRQLQTSGLVELIERNATLAGTELLDALIWDVSNWSGDADFADDVSALLFEFTG